MKIKLLLGDCLEHMRAIPDASVDLILCDLPYGTTACKWDVLIPFELLWAQYGRIAKGPIVLTSAQPFTSLLVSSKLSWFKHEWVWDKVRPCGMLNAKHQPMMRHESVCVFSKSSTHYSPIMESRIIGGQPALEEEWQESIDARDYHVSGTAGQKSGNNYVIKDYDGEERTYTEKYPQSIIRFCKPTHPVHSTQKPVDLMAYLIRTYTHGGGTVLDNCMGSGTTGIACVETGHDFIGIESDPDVFNTALTRIGEALLLPHQQESREQSAAQPGLF